MLRPSYAKVGSTVKRVETSYANRFSVSDIVQPGRCGKQFHVLSENETKMLCLHSHCLHMCPTAG